MSTVGYGCGCWITKSMFGDRPVLSVGHCDMHKYLWSQDKSLRQMAAEIRKVQE